MKAREIEGRPTRGRRRGAIIAGILLLGVIGGVWWWRRPPEGFIVDVLAEDDGNVLVVWRLNPHSGDSREWVAHFDGAGKLDWRRELPGLTSSHATLVVLTSIPRTPDYHYVPTPFLQAFYVAGKLIEQVIEGDEHLSNVLYAIDPGSGQVLGHAQVGASSEPVGPLVVGDRLVLHENGPEVTVVDTSHGIAVTKLHEDVR